MSTNHKNHNRKSIRLKGYDYSQAGFYFVTICCQNKECLYGEVRNGNMILNDAGIMIKKWYHELGNKFPDIKCHEMVVMPNHFHCIIENIGSVGADLRVCPNISNDVHPNMHTTTDEQSTIDKSSMGESTIDKPIMGESMIDKSIMDEHIGSPLRDVVQWFKTMTTNEYIRGVKNKNWQRFNGKLWQRNYWEHIIRNEKSFDVISIYIYNNPKNWEKDRMKS